jgi:DNA polymerase-3 subunit beta
MTSLTCDASALLKALRAVNEISISTKETQAILKNVLFVIDGNSATLTRTNYDGAITKTLAVESKGKWSFTVGGQKLAQVVGTFDGGAQVNLSVEDGWLRMKCGRSNTRYGVLDAKTFPLLTFDDASPSFTVDADYVRSLALVAHAADGDETRVNFAGAAHQWRDGKLNLKTTDGNRMARVVTAGGEMPDVICPTAAVSLLLSLAAEAAEIEVAAMDGRMRWRFGDTVLTYKMIEGKFPDTDRVTREESPVVINVDADTLLSVIGRIMILADDKDRTCRWTIAENLIRIESRGLGDQGADEILCGIVGDGFELAFRTQFIRDALNALDVDTVELGLVDARAPMMIRSPAKPDALLVVMPTV